MTIHETATLQAPFGRAVYYDLDDPMRMHVHSALHVLIHLGGAPARYTFADGDEVVSDEARVTLVDPWIAHTDERHGRRRSQVLALYVEPTLLRRRGGAFGEVRFRARSGTLGRERRSAIGALARCVRGADVDGARLFAEVVRGLIADHGAWDVKGGFPGSGALDRHVRRALEFLNDRKGQPFDGAALMAQSGLGRSRLHGRFREVVGLPPKRYADALRAEAAIGLLTAKDRTVAEIGKELGFAAPAHFTRFLRDYTGLTPTEHRLRAAMRGPAEVYVDEFE